MLNTNLDLRLPITRAMLAVCGYLQSRFQLSPTLNSYIPKGCIELSGPQIFVAGVLIPDASNVPLIEAAVRASKYDCIIIGLKKHTDGAPIAIDIIQYGSDFLHYHPGLHLYEHRGRNSLFIDTMRSASARPHGLRASPWGLVATGELPRLCDIAGLRSSNDFLRRCIGPAGAPQVNRRGVS
jgi:hypothetical protein